MAAPPLQRRTSRSWSRTTASPGHVVATVAGKPAGEHVERPANAHAGTVRIELVDAHTILVLDTKHGRFFCAKA